VTSTRNIIKYFALYAVAVVIAAAQTDGACKNALDNINATLAAASADAQKYIPDQLASAQSKVAALSASLRRRTTRR